MRRLLLIGVLLMTGCGPKLYTYQESFDQCVRLKVAVSQKPLDTVQRYECEAYAARQQAVITSSDCAGCNLPLVVYPRYTQ